MANSTKVTIDETMDVEGRMTTSHLLQVEEQLFLLCGERRYRLSKAMICAIMKKYGRETLQQPDNATFKLVGGVLGVFSFLATVDVVAKNYVTWQPSGQPTTCVLAKDFVRMVVFVQDN